MDLPSCVHRRVFEALRGDRPCEIDVQALWVCGDLQALRCPSVAIVGTRAASGYGKGLARRFAGELSAAGCCIISGLALGIDGAAHEGAVGAGGPTIGVLGGGHEVFFPQRNRALAQRMLAAGGAVISPYPPQQPPLPANFLQRNAIVAGLSDAVVVIEAPARSGALNTAGWAAGRVPVFAVPGDVDRPMVAGCHALIRDGAILARDPLDVLAELKMTSATTAPPQPQFKEPMHEVLWHAVESGEPTLDELARTLRAPAHVLLPALGVLELRGLVESRPGARYARRASARDFDAARR